MKIGICGICGRMGVMITHRLLERGHTLSAAFDHEKAAQFGRDVGELLHSDVMGVTIRSINAGDAAKCDGIIDFSTPAAGMQLLDVVRDVKKPIVIGTTGFTEEQKSSIERASHNVPVLFSPNMAMGVNLLFKLTEMAARALTSDYDVEIFEAHHRHKKDAPSGTAKRLMEIIKGNMAGLSNAKEVPGRDGIVGERTNNEVGILAMRGGDIVGDHTVFFATEGERIELTHRNTSREALVKGAVAGMEFIANQPPRLYTMYDVLGF